MEALRQSAYNSSATLSTHVMDESTNTNNYTTTKQYFGRKKDHIL
jgi:hypothetical protein